MLDKAKNQKNAPGLLGKMLKNDFLQTGRVFAWLLGGGIAIGGIGALFTLNQEIGMAQFFVASLWNFLLIIGASALQAIGLVFILVSTNRSLFTERGYLTFALPVSSTKMLFSKFLTNVFFMVVCVAEAAGLIYVAFFNFRRLFLNIGQSVTEQLGPGSMSEMDMIGEMVQFPSFSDVVIFASFILVVLLVFMVLVMMGSLFVLTLSHVRPFQNKPGLWMPIFFVGLFVACQHTVSRVGKLVSIPIVLDFGGVLDTEIPLNMIIAVVMVALTVLLFFATNWLMKRKISLK